MSRTSFSEPTRLALPLILIRGFGGLGGLFGGGRSARPMGSYATRKSGSKRKDKKKRKKRR